MEEPFQCYYCSLAVGEFPDIIGHCINTHGKDILKIRYLSLNENDGRYVYISKNYSCIPDDVRKNKQEISPNADKMSITLVNCSETLDDSTRSPLHKKIRSRSVDRTRFRDSGSGTPTSLKSRSHSVERDTTSISYTTPEVMDFELYDSIENTDSMKQIYLLIPSVLEAMKSIGKLDSWLKFHKGISDGNFPLQNIAFRLFLDVVEWFSLETTQEMRYSHEVLRFWRTGYKLFHGRFIRFCGGYKNMGQKRQGMVFKPEESKINFAIPDIRLLTGNSTSKKKENPGILSEMLTALDESKIYNLCFDGKKINSGKTQHGGDINLFGHETAPTLSQRKDRLAEEEQALSDLDELLNSDAFWGPCLNQTSLQHRTNLIKQYERVNSVFSERIKELRKMKVSKNLAIDKFKKLSGPNWRKGKYIYVISSLETAMFDINITLRELLVGLDKVHASLSTLHDSISNFCDAEIVSLSNQANYLCLDPTVVHSDPEKNSRFIPQRTDEWFELRKKASVTGSTAHAALGLGSLKKQQEHYDKFILHHELKEPDMETKKRMQYGTDNEINCLGTLVAKIMPAYFPHIKYSEEGCGVIRNGDNSFFIISPDGSGIKGENDHIAFEFKCPYPGKVYTPPVHYAIPDYYVPQLLSEMRLLGVDKLLYVCYSQESTTAFEVKYDSDLWNKMWLELDRMYGGEQPQRPKKTSEMVPVLKEQVKSFLDTHTRFLGEFKSLTAQPCIHDTCTTNAEIHKYHRCHGTERELQPYNRVTVLGARENVVRLSENLAEVYHLTRTKASEILCFLLSDLDRVATHETRHAYPIAYGLKGYSLNCETVRNMMNHVLQECKKNGIHVPVASFDGQWSKIVVRDEDGNPLTLCQLQKDVFEEAKSKKKNEIVKHIFNLNRVNITCEAELQQISIAKSGTQLVVYGKVNIEQPLIMTQDIGQALSDQKVKKTKESKPEETLADSNEKHSDIGDAILSVLPDSVLKAMDSELISLVHETAKNIEKECRLNRDQYEHEPTQYAGDNVDQCLMQNIGYQEIVTDDTTNNISKPSPSNSPDTELDVVMMTLLVNVPSHKRRKWSYKKDDLKVILSSGTQIEQTFTKEELKICIDAFVQQRSEPQKYRYSKSWNKKRLATMLHFIYSGATPTPGVGSCKPKTAMSLQKLCHKVINTFSKRTLDVVYANHIYPQRLKEWKDNSPIKDTVKIHGTNEPDIWYSRPEHNKVINELLFTVLDSHHILTNARSKVCSSGMTKAGLSKEAWIAVARDNNTGLNRAMVEDLIDRQSDSFARKTFSFEVESSMVEKGFIAEAEFCHLLRDWYAAEDDPGINAQERCQKRFALRSWLLKDVHFDTFPPPGAYVKDIPIVMYEGLLTSIERKTQLYSAVISGFNQRALTTLDIENFFGWFRDLDPKGTGVVHPDDLPTVMRTALELSTEMLDTHRGYHMRTSRSPVYPCHELERMQATQNGPGKTWTSISEILQIEPRNHWFDEPKRHNRRPKRKHGDVKPPDQPGRGVQPIRAFHKRDESKIFPHVRRGINLSDVIPELDESNR